MRTVDQHILVLSFPDCLGMVGLHVSSQLTRSSSWLELFYFCLGCLTFEFKVSRVGMNIIKMRRFIAPFLLFHARLSGFILCGLDGPYRYYCVWNSVLSMWSDVSCFPYFGIFLKALFFYLFTHLCVCQCLCLCPSVCECIYMYIRDAGACVQKQEEASGCPLSSVPVSCIWARLNANKSYICLHPAWSCSNNHCQDTHLFIWVLGSKL